MKKLIACVLSLIAFQLTTFAQVNIAAARQATLNSTVTIRGIVVNGGELGSIRYVQDTSAGIALYGTNLNSVNRGDSIVATGTLTNYNNLLEVQPVSTFSTFTPVMAAPLPQLITPSQMGEAFEGELVRIDNAVMANAGGIFAGNTSYNFTSNSQTGVVYVHTGSPLVGQLIPNGTISIIGVLSQYSSTYQLLPRDTADFISNGSIVITTPLQQTNMNTTGFDINWSTNVTGSTYIHYGKTPALELGTLSGAAGTSHTVSITGASASDIFFVKAFSVNGTDTAASAVRSFATVSASTGTITVYFDKSVDTSLSTGTDAVLLFHTLDDTLISYINRAQHTIDVAIYSFDNQNISNITTALNNADNRGVKVRVVSDGGNNNPALNTLNASIPVLNSPTTSAYGIMHNKFLIIDAKSSNPDEAILWTGSTNWTDNQLQTDANNVIIFQDQSIAKGYTLEFEEMWGDTDMTPNLASSRFGPYKTDNTPHQYLIGGKTVEQYFSPSDGTNAKIVSKIATANTDLCVATMHITRSDLAYALTGASDNGVSTYVLVMDSSTTSTWPILRSGLPTGHLAYYHATGIMHHKYMIVDPSNISSDPMVLTGSHNWSTAADTKNDENMVVVHDATIANIYYQEFVPRFTQNGGVLSVQEPAAESMRVTAFPNPANEQLTLQFDAAHAGSVSLHVTDMTGRVVMQQDVFAMKGANSAGISTDKLASGTYLILLKGEGFSGVCKLVVQR